VSVPNREVHKVRICEGLTPIKNIDYAFLVGLVGLGLGRAQFRIYEGLLVSIKVRVRISERVFSPSRIRCWIRATKAVLFPVPGPPLSKSLCRGGESTASRCKCLVDHGRDTTIYGGPVPILIAVVNIILCSLVAAPECLLRYALIKSRTKFKPFSLITWGR